MVVSGFPAPFNRPVILHADGWEADTHKLSLMGWELHADQRVYDNVISLVAHNPKTGLVAYAHVQNFNYTRNVEYGSPAPHLRAVFGHRDKVQIHRVYHDHSTNYRTYSGTTSTSGGTGTMIFSVRSNTDTFANFHRVGGAMEMRTEIRTLADLMHFKPIQQIAVEADPTIDDLLAKIVAKQSETNDEYFKEKVRAGKIVPATSAEIVQFTRAA